MAKKRRKGVVSSNRFAKARSLVTLNAVKSLRVDKSGRIINALVPGSQAKTYEVIARREGRNYIETECLLQTGAGTQECKGGWSAVCYHALAVLLTSAAQNGLDAAICQSLASAQRRKNINGNVYKIQSKHAPKNPLWLVVNRTDAANREELSAVVINEARKTAEQIKKELGY